MTYRNDIPNQSNRVRGASGDLVFIRENFQELNYLRQAITPSGTFPSRVISGIDLGGVGWNMNVSGNALVWTIPAGGVVTWAANGIVTFPNFVFVPITPTASGHAASKAYVDGAAGSTTLSGLADTALSGAAEGQLLAFQASGATWVPSGITVQEDDGTPTLVRVHTIVASGDLALVSGGPGIAILSGGGAAPPEVSGAVFTTPKASGDQSYQSGLHAISGLSGLTPPGSPASGGSPYVLSFGADAINDGGPAALFDFAIHIGSGGTVSDPIAYEINRTSVTGGAEGFIGGIPELPVTIASGDLVTVTLSGSQDFTIKSTSGTFGWLRLRDGDSAVGGGGGGGGGTGLERIALRLSANDTTVASGDTCPFDTAETANGLTLAASGVVLTNGKTYRLDGAVRVEGSAAGGLAWNLYNDTQSEVIGPSFVSQTTSSTGHKSPGGYGSWLYTASGADKVIIRYGGLLNIITVESLSTYLLITEVP